MQDKVFDLLEKVYIELQETKNELKETKIELKNDIRRIDAKIENEISDKIQLLFEGQELIKQDLGDIKTRLGSIENKVERHDIKIQVIEGGKKKTS